MNLGSCHWIKKHQNVIITGPTGVGKTFLACPLATNKACRDGNRTFYIRVPKFYYHVGLAKADGSYTKLMKKLLKTHLLLLDDFGLPPMADDSERRDLLEVIEDRHGHASTIMTSQLPLEHWHESIGDPSIADAILDRLIHNAHGINLKGGSMRKNSKLTQIDFCVKDLSTPVSLRSDTGVAGFNRNEWPLWSGTTGRIQRNKQWTKKDHLLNSEMIEIYKGTSDKEVLLFKDEL
jgi:hypothetical protein